MNSKATRILKTLTPALLVLAGLMLSLVFMLGLFTYEQRQDVYITAVPCNQACEASLEHFEARDGFIELSRPVLICTYDTAYAGRLTQTYWAGPWQGPLGSALPDGVSTPDSYDGERLSEAIRGKDGQALCPRHFNLRYGQREAEPWTP